MIDVVMQSSKDRAYRPIVASSGDPWSELSVELQQDLQAWDAMFQKGWNPRRGWTVYSEWEGEVYERVAVRLHARLRAELDSARFHVAELVLPPFAGESV